MSFIVSVGRQANPSASPQRKSLQGATVLLCICFSLPVITAGCTATPNAATLNSDDRNELTLISAYLDGLQRFQADFTQTGPQGFAKGIVWVDRPGKLRVEYYRPGPKTILANRGRLLFADHLTHATEELPVSKTPLDILLAGAIPLSGPVTVLALQHQDDALLVSLAKTAAPEQGTLTLRFAEHPLALTGVTIKDRNGQVTALDLENLVRNPVFAPDRFLYHPDPVQPEM